MHSPRFLIVITGTFLAILAVTVLLWPSEDRASAGVLLYGDANCDSTVNAIDSLFILQFNAGLLSTLACEEQADVNGDGNVNSLDAALVLQFEAGLISSLGPMNTPTARPTNTPALGPTSTPTARPTNTPALGPTSTPTPSDQAIRGQWNDCNDSWTSGHFVEISIHFDRIFGQDSSFHERQLEDIREYLEANCRGIGLRLATVAGIESNCFVFLEYASSLSDGIDFWRSIGKVFFSDAFALREVVDFVDAVGC